GPTGRPLVRLMNHTPMKPAFIASSKAENLRLGRARNSTARVICAAPTARKAMPNGRESRRGGGGHPGGGGGEPRGGEGRVGARDEGGGWGGGEAAGGDVWGGDHGCQDRSGAPPWASAMMLMLGQSWG